MDNKKTVMQIIAENRFVHILLHVIGGIRHIGHQNLDDSKRNRSSSGIAYGTGFPKVHLAHIELNTVGLSRPDDAQITVSGNCAVGHIFVRGLLTRLIDLIDMSHKVPP